MATTTLTSTRPPFYRDTKVIGIVLQVVFAILVFLFAWLLYSNMISELSAINNSAGSPLTWNFLGQTAGFEISEGPLFRPEESYFRAFLVGFANTLRVSLVGIVLATLLGVMVGIARVSNNWLLSKIAHVYTDIFRSTPLLVQLLFWYFGVIAALPDVKEATDLGGFGYLSNRGIFLTWPYLSQTGGRGLYTRLGNVPHGRFLSFAIKPPAAGGAGATVRRATPADALACSRLYAAEPVHFARTYADFAEALGDPPGNTYVYADRWLIERDGEAVAYLCLGSDWHEPLSRGIRHVGEYAGSRTAMAAVLGTLFTVGGVRELTWPVAWQDTELIRLLQAGGYRAELVPLYGHTFRILNFPRLMADLRPLLQARLPANLLRGLRFEQSGPLLGGLGEDRYAIVRGADRLELNGAAMTRLIMGSADGEDEPIPRSSALAEVVPALFPLPSFLPGLNYH